MATIAVLGSGAALPTACTSHSAMASNNGLSIYFDSPWPRVACFRRGAGEHRTLFLVHPVSLIPLRAPCDELYQRASRESIEWIWASQRRGRWRYACMQASLRRHCRHNNFMIRHAKEFNTLHRNDRQGGSYRRGSATLTTISPSYSRGLWPDVSHAVLQPNSHCLAVLARCVRNPDLATVAMTRATTTHKSHRRTQLRPFTRKWGGTAGEATVRGAAAASGGQGPVLAPGTAPAERSPGAGCGNDPGAAHRAQHAPRGSARAWRRSL